MSTPYILILYYSAHGSTKSMAELISRGALSVDGIETRLRTVPRVSSEPSGDLKQSDQLYVSKDDLRNCAGIILGSPTRFGNMAAPLKHFLDSTSDIWLSGGLIGKPAACFTSSSSMHGGQESTILTMLLPLMHHGALIMGIPYSSSELNSTTSGGTPYGPSHVAGQSSNPSISQDEKAICMQLGKRMATTALLLN